MAKKSAPKEADPKETVLVEAAKKLGAAAAKIAALAGAVPDAPPAAAVARARTAKPGKLQKKDKSRLPRRQKKALRKSQH